MPRESLTNYELTDSDIKRLVTEALAWEEKLPYQNVRIDVDRGVVFLSGIVDTLEQKVKAVRATERVAGVTCVVDNIVVKPARKATDEELREIVSRLISEDGRITSSKDFEVSVENGIASVRGEVATVAEKWAALDDARSVSGVKDVIDEIIVIPQETVSDHTLEQLVTAEMTSALGLDARLIHAHVKDGLVHLQGTVRFASQKSMAEQIASEIPGIRGVKNDIIVKG